MVDVRRHASNVDELERRIRDLAPPGTTVEITLFPSNALDVLVRLPDGPVIVMEGAADETQYGLTPDLRTDDAGFHDGHDLLFNTYEAAVEVLLSLVR